MAERLWFTPKSMRRITLRTYGVLVGKAPEKRKRIKMLCTMPLTGQKVTGFPTWLADARDFVMKNGEVIKASQTIDYCNVTMHDEQSLFQKTPIEAPKSKLSHFSIENTGSSEDPDTVLKFQIIAPFSTDLNRWCGAMAGEEFDSSYEVTDAPEEEEEEDELELESEDDATEEDGEEDEVKAQEKRRQSKKQTAAQAASEAAKAANDPKKVAEAKNKLAIM